MMKKLVVTILMSLLALPLYAEESDNFMPIGFEPSISLSKESTEVRPLPTLNFYDALIPVAGIDGQTYSIQSGLILDDTPINVVYLDENIDKPSLVLPTNLFHSPVINNQNSNAITARSVFAPKNVYISEASKTAQKINGYAYESTGNFSFGAGYNRGLDKAQMEDNTSLFTRYEGEYFAINSQYIASSKQNLGTQANSFKISPEVKLNNQFKIRTGFQSYTNLPLKKGEVVLVYSPSVKKYLDSLSFELGVARRYNTQTGISGSEIRFSTGFKL